MHSDMLQSQACLQPLFSALESLLQQKTHCTLAIEGPACSGKSTLAAFLAERYGGAIIPMDAFFLPQSLRTEKRLAVPGGNIHYERFLEEAARGIRLHTNFSYYPLNCASMALRDAVEVKNAPLRIMEGCYSMHPKFAGLYDFSVFLEISEANQLLRLRKRETPQQAERFQKEWIPMENRYFEAYDIRTRANIVLRMEQAAL